MLQFMISAEEAGQMLRHYLQASLGLSNRFIKRLTSKPGYLYINEQEVTVRYILQAGDRLAIRLPKEKRSPWMQPEPMPLTIVYEDDWLLILEKEAGVPSIPSKLHPSGTIANGLLAYYDEQQLAYTVHVVTRLDKDTSGLMLVAKHQYSHSLLSAMQQKQAIQRQYEALVTGRLTPLEATIRNRIRRKPSSIIEREVSDEGQLAITHYRVLGYGEQYSHVRIQLETGRTHQIRVHFAFLGHPLLGDDLYGGRTDLLERQALHCASLSFQHPITKAQLSFHSPPPSEWCSLLGDRSDGKGRD